MSVEKRSEHGHKPLLARVFRRFGLFLTLYRCAYIAFVFFGAFVPVRAAWDAADICNALMAFPNVVTLLLLAKQGLD